MAKSQDPSRHISRLTSETLALIMAGGRGSRLHELTRWRAKPAVYFGGKFRIIDFPLSNCVNSGIRRIGVLTQYKSHSLVRHLVRGWSHFKPELGEFVDILPASQRTSDEWYVGTADSIYQNLDIVEVIAPAYVLVLAGDHVYKMDYGRMLAHHEQHGARITVGCVEVPLAEASAFGVMSVDQQGKVIGFDEKPASPQPRPGSDTHALASMGIYVFDREFLFEQLQRDAADPASSRDFGRDIIPRLVGEEMYAYAFRDPATGAQAYWRDVGTIDAFWTANLELVRIAPELNLYDRDWPIWTHQAQLPPAKFVFDDDDRRGEATDSMVSGGCIISGARIRRSLLFSNVVVHSYATLEDAVVLPEVDIGRNCRIRRAVIDRGCQLPPGAEIGFDRAADAQRYRVTDSGVVLVTPDMLGQRHLMAH